ncbi:MAG: hypothetical protein ACYC2G_12095 [Gemmatimonadaceae bacterium]
MLLLAACDPRAGQARTAHMPAGNEGFASTVPVAEFLVAGMDSSFWIRTGPDAGPTGMEVRRAPLVLARLAGRWQELYVAEEDHSFHDAVFVAQALWRRDLVSDDSVLVSGDAMVPAMAAEYARGHPGELPLEPDEPEAEEPSIVAAAELSLLDLQGGYASIEHHSDLHLPHIGERHEVRRTVVELASGRELRLPALLGEAAAADVARRGRTAFVVARDSARRAVRKMDAAAAQALDGFSFDARSFALTQVADRPGVVFFAVGHGEAAGGFVLPLAPLVVDGGAWWDSARVDLPAAGGVAGASVGETGSRHWRRGPLTVVARSDVGAVTGRGGGGGDDRAPAGHAGPDRLALRDSAGREWPLGPIGSPARRLYWLGADDVTAVERRAIARAFYDAAMYDGTVRAAGLPDSRGAAPASTLRLAAASSAHRTAGRLGMPPSGPRHVARRPAIRSRSPIQSR